MSPAMQGCECIATTQCDLSVSLGCVEYGTDTAEVVRTVPVCHGPVCNTEGNDSAIENLCVFSFA
jgi:hypothetical protein